MPLAPVSPPALVLVWFATSEPRSAAAVALTVTLPLASSALFDAVHEAYLADPRVREFLLRENPAAARAIVESLDDARRKGFWHPHRNDLGDGLRALQAEATL